MASSERSMITDTDIYMKREKENRWPLIFRALHKSKMTFVRVIWSSETYIQHLTRIMHQEIECLRSLGGFVIILPERGFTLSERMKG